MAKHTSTNLVQTVTVTLARDLDIVGRGNKGNLLKGDGTIMKSADFHSQLYLAVKKRTDDTFQEPKSSTRTIGSKALTRFITEKNSTEAEKKEAKAAKEAEKEAKKKGAKAAKEAKKKGAKAAKEAKKKAEEAKKKEEKEAKKKAKKEAKEVNSRERQSAAEEKRAAALCQALLKLGASAEFRDAQGAMSLFRAAELGRAAVAGRERVVGFGKAEGAIIDAIKRILQ